MYTGLHVKYPLFLSDFNATWILSVDYWKHSHIKFYENLSSGSTVVPCAQTDGRTGTTKLIVASRHFANATKRGTFSLRSLNLRVLWQQNISKKCMDGHISIFPGTQNHGTSSPPPPLVHRSRNGSCEVCDKQLLAAPVSPTYVHIYHRYIKNTGRHSVCLRTAQMRRDGCPVTRAVYITPLHVSREILAMKM
jgi:hypothetical protein